MKALKWVGIVLVVLLLAVILVPLVIPIPPLEGITPISELADADSRFIEVNGLQVHYKQMGSGDQAIILLHGFGASTYSWRNVIEPLSEYGTVIAYDRPSSGLTERPLPGSWSGESPYGVEANVDLLFGLMDALGIEKAILVGNSAGGTVAAYAALEHPERVQAIVFVDAAIFTKGGMLPEWLMPLLDTPQAARLGPWFMRNIREWGLEMLVQAWHDPALITDEIRENYQKPLSAPNWDQGLWGLVRAERPESILDRLDTFAMPVLVVTGDDDRIVPTEQSLQLADAIPQANLVVFKDCGHVPQEECPQAFLEAVVPFIQQIKE